MALSALAGCSRKATGRVPAAEGNRVSTYIFGEVAKQYALGNHDAAYELLHQTLRVNPRHAPSLALLAQYENYLRHPGAADSLLMQALALDPTNPDYLEANAVFKGNGDDIDASIDAFERLAAVRPRSVSVLGQLSNLYVRADMPDSAVSVLDRIENLQGLSEQIASSKMLMRLSMGDSLGAVAEMQRLVDEYPHDPNYAVLLGNAYLRVLDNADSARAVYDRVERMDPANGRLQMARLNLYERTDTARYAAYHDRLLYGPDTDSELRKSLIMRYIGRQQRDSAGQRRVLAMFDSVLTHKQEDALILSTYAAYLLATSVGGDTLTSALKRILDVDPANRGALNELIGIYARNNDPEGISAACDHAITYYPHEPVFYYYSAMGHYMQGDTLTALERVTVGCEHIDESTSTGQAAGMYVLQGDLLHGMGRIEESFAAYDSCLVYEPDNISCLNNYAYYISLTPGGDLEKAERMSYRTVRAAPDSRTYLDTYAWILFKQGNYDEAAVYMDRVMDGIATDVAEEPEDVSAAVFEHAGDIYACQGDVDKAMPYWLAAQRLGCKSKTLAQKIKKKKFIENRE